MDCSRAILGRDQRFSRYFGQLGLHEGIFRVCTCLRHPRGCLIEGDFKPRSTILKYFRPLGLPKGVFPVCTCLRPPKGCSRAILGRDQRLQRYFGPLGLP